VTYDIQLAQVLVNTAGTVTVTDERTWAAVGTTGIALQAVAGSRIALQAVATAQLLDDAVTAAKIADGAIDATAKLANDVVDDTKVGNRVPQFYRRQGGSATNWSTAGTTTYTPTAVRMQAGVIATVGGTATVTFPVAFSQPPVVVAVTREAVCFAVVVSVTATGCVINNYFYGSGSLFDSDINWLAIGPE
jgi:hypothetical protein